MEKELLKYIKENNLSPFNNLKSKVKKPKQIFKTRDAKTVANKTLKTISSFFKFSDTSNLFYFFSKPDNQEIKKRQEFFNKIPLNLKNDFLSDINKPKPSWKPEYNIIVATESEEIYMKLKDFETPVQLILSQNDLLTLENCDIVQVIDTEEYTLQLEQLPQSVFLDSIDEVYLERHLIQLSGWKNNLQILKNNFSLKQSKQIIDDFAELFDLISENANKIIQRDEVESKLMEINKNIQEKIKQTSIPGESLFEILSKGQMPEILEKIILKEIKKTGFPENIFEFKIPVSIDEKEFEEVLKKQQASQFTSVSKEIKKHSSKLINIPKKLNELSSYLLIQDFVSGISQFFSLTEKFPEISGNKFSIKNSKNIFLENPQSISFLLDEHKCSILTGANSGGKTTLIEHIIQLVTLSQLGLKVSGQITLPLFTDVYYFAKNKGAISKGAFENLLDSLSKIKPGKSTLILADEIESVTEPGTAGNIIAATASYFLDQNCYLVIATHLGQEIKDFLPKKARIDGIEAKGLTEEYDLIVDHNPVLGKIASSTPELIVEKLANSEKTPYYQFLHNYLQNNNSKKTNQ